MVAGSIQQHSAPSDHSVTVQVVAVLMVVALKIVGVSVAAKVLPVVKFTVEVVVQVTT